MGASASCQRMNWKGMPGADACRTCESLWPEKRASVDFLVPLPVGGKEEWNRETLFSPSVIISLLLLKVCVLIFRVNLFLALLFRRTWKNPMSSSL